MTRTKTAVVLLSLTQMIVCPPGARPDNSDIGRSRGESEKETLLYQGPLVQLVGGIDITWITGMIVSGFLYYYFTTRQLTLTSENEHISTEV